MSNSDPVVWDSVDWYGEFYDKFSQTESQDDVVELVKSELDRMGFEYFLFLCRSATPFTNKRRSLFGSCASGWIERYREGDLSTQDPSVVTSGSRTSPLVVWNDELRSRNKPLFEEAASWGFKFGATITTRGLDSNMRAMAFAREREDITPREINLLNVRMRLIMSLLEEKPFCKIPSDLENIKLSEREKCILKWTADGKTSSEIADIIYISQNTVNYHIKNILKKFNTSSRVLAASYAVALDLL